MKRRSPSLVFLLILTLFCLAGLATIGLLGYLPEEAAQRFGPPSSSLDALQRLELSVQLLLNQGLLTKPLDPSGAPQAFVIAPGESTYAITTRLQEEGLIADAQVFRDYLVYSGLDTTIQAGEYKLSSRMTANEIAYALQDATPGEVTFNILAGWRMEEIAAALPTSGLLFSPTEFLARITRPSPELASALGLPDSATLEGFLFPDSYRVSRQITVEQFIDILLEDFQLKINKELQDGYRGQGLSLYQAVTLASMIEREAVVDAEMPVIASVFFNRLAAGMKLDSDPTVQYALGYNSGQKTWWTNPLSASDLQFASPYNTYLNAGLPPGPIANPGLSALRAVAYPSQTPYFYFRAACDGSGLHQFSITFQEHQQNACP